MSKVDPHTTEIPFGKYRGTRVVELPLSYLRWLKNQTGDFGNKDWIEIADVELKRRNFVEQEFHFSEHSIERFSQRFFRLNPGIITQMKDQFQKALRSGTWIDENHLLSDYKNSKVKWTVAKTKLANGLISYEIISFVLKDRDEHFKAERQKRKQQKKQLGPSVDDELSDIDEEDNDGFHARSGDQNDSQIQD